MFEIDVTVLTSDRLGHCNALLGGLVRQHRSAHDVTDGKDVIGRRPVAIIDFKPEGFFQKRHATPADTIRSEMQSAGYVLAESFDYLERQTFQVFVPTR